jgi:hypothetical protein
VSWDPFLMSVGEMLETWRGSIETGRPHDFAA